MKRLLSLVLGLCLTVSLILPAAAAEKDGFSNFRAVNTYSYDSFADVSGWYADYVSSAYTVGLMQGSTNESGERIFNPGGNVTLAEAVTLASRIHSIYASDDAVFAQESPWYQTYVDYAVKTGILSSRNEYEDYTRTANRAQFAAILAKALPADACAEINTVEVGAIPDVDMEQRYALDVYKLYRAGILTGGEMGAFSPDKAVSRSEMAAIASRMVDPSLRCSFTLYAPLYVGFTRDSQNQGLVGITDLTMTTDGTDCYLTMDFKSQQSRFLSLMNASGSIYILNVVVIDPNAEHVTFTFPMETLRKIYTASSRPASEKLILEFYASGDPASVTDRFSISIGQFEKYFSAGSAADGV